MKIENRQQMLVILAAVAVGLWLGDTVLFTPLGQAWKARSKRLAELEKKVTQGKALIAREASLHQKWDNMRTNTLSTDNSMAEQQLLTAADHWLTDSRVTLNSFHPQPKHTAEDFLTLEARIEVTGSIDRLTRFVYDLEKDPLAVRVESVDLSTRDADGREMSLNLQVSALVLPTPDKP